MDNNKAQGWGKTLGGAIGASFGPEHALIGIAIGGVLEEILPGPKDILGNILGNLGSDGLKQAWQQTIARRTSHAQAQISSDLQQAFRDAVLEGLYDIGGSACFPDQWTNARRVVPDGVTIAPLTSETRDYLQALVAAITQGTLIPLEPSAHAAVDAQRYVAAESFDDLNQAFLAHVIGPDKPFRSLRGLPQLHAHLHRHWLDRTLVHLGDLLRQRPATWHEFNRVMFETLLVALRQLGTGQAQIAQQVERLTAVLTDDAFVVGMSARQAELLAAIGETNKDLREGITTIFWRVVHHHAEVIARFDQQDTLLHEILNQLTHVREREQSPHLTALHALPPRPGDFQGRADEITQLSDVLQQNGPQGTVATICGVGGLGGIGKTALATAVAQEVKRTYPDEHVVAEHSRFPGALPHICNVPHLRNPNFTGRDLLLEQLHTALQATQPAALVQALHGLGGIGKTQLAVEYVYRHAAEYDVIWWVRAEESATLGSDYAELACALALPEQAATEQALMIAAVRRWLEQHSRWLLIFDNATVPANLNGYHPRSMIGRIIVTSRSPNWGEVATALAVPVFEADEAVDLLVKRTRQTDRAAAQVLADTLGRLPLALVQATAYIEQTGCTLTHYLTLFQTHQRHLLTRGKPSNYPATVATTWELAFQHLPPAATDLLNLCAFLAPEDLPLEMLQTGAEHLPKRLSTVVTDKLALDEAVAALRGYSLIEASNDTLSVHRMVQAVTRSRLGTTTKHTWAGVAITFMRGVFPNDAASVRTWATCASLLSHAIAATSHAEHLSVTLEVTAGLLNRMGLYFYSRAAYAEAQMVFERALVIYEKILGPTHPDTATSLNNVAAMRLVKRNYPAAQALFERALTIREQMLGLTHPHTAQSLNNVALVHEAQGNYPAAQALFERALTIRKQMLGLTHPHTAQSLNNLGGMHYAQGNYVEAQRLFERALAIYEQILGSAHPHTATSLNNVALVYQAQGNYAVAQALFERALPVLVQVLGLEHPDTALSLNNLGSVLQAQGQHAEAQGYLEQAFAIYQQVLGPEHPHTHIVRNNLTALNKLLNQT